MEPAYPHPSPTCPPCPVHPTVGGPTLLPGAQMHCQMHDHMLQVQKRPLKVAVEHLKDLPYSSGDDIVKATYMELVSSLKDLLAQHPIYREQLQSSYQFGSDFQDLSRLSDMAAALTSASETDLQNVLAQLNIPDRWGGVCVLLAITA